MTFRGRVQNGVVVPEAGAVLPEGAEVRIDVAIQPNSPGEVDSSPKDSTAPPLPSMVERYQNIIGVIHDLPEDASERVDDLLYGNSSS